MRERHRLRLRKRYAQEVGNTGRKRISSRMTIVAADKQKCLGIKLSVIHSRQTILRSVERSGYTVDPNLVRLEDRAHLVILLLQDRFIHVVVAASAPQGQSQKCLRGMVDCVLHPFFAAQQLEIPRKVSRGSDGIRVLRPGFVRREHRHDHAVVRLVAIERLDDPVAPVPDMRLAVADLLSPSSPVAVPPNVHPMSSPALAVLRTGQQLVDDSLVCILTFVCLEGMKLVGRGG